MEKELDFIAERIEKYIEDTKKITATPGKGVTRLPFTLESKRCVHYLEKQMSQMGLDVIEDASGAVIGILKGKSPERIMIGSHYDSVEHGGGYLSSKAFLGKWTTNDLKDYVDKNGISYYDAMILYGYSPEHLIRAERPRKGWKGYLEIHVEQGPIMEDQGTEIGIVETIVAIERYYITIIGKADHAGTQPMDTRSDAVMAAVDVITKLRQYVMEHKGMVGTVGEIHVYPNQINIVPEKITFSIDVRSADQAWLDACIHKISEEVKKKESEGFSCELKQTISNSVTKMKPEWVKQLEKSAKKLGFSNMRLNSGAGHDAAIIGKEIDTAMLFVPSIGGRSHIPEEYSNEKDLAKAVLTAIHFIDHLQ